MRRVIAGLISVGDRYRILAEEGFSKEEMHHDEKDELTSELYGLVARGQGDGSFTSALSPRWILTAMGHLIMAAIQQVQAGELARNHAATTVADTLFEGIRGTARQ
jgi:hypothetical protein